MILQQMAGLMVRVVDDLPEDARPALAVVLCHGFGAPGTDLVNLAPELLEASPKLAATTRFYFPEAPLSLDSYGLFGGRAWWLIDLDEFMAAAATGKPRTRVATERPEGLLEAREAVTGLVKEIQRETGLPPGKLALGGFSQGSMVTMDVALQMAESPACLIAWSGTLLNEEEWRANAPKHAGLNVVQSHGRQDPILPYGWAETLRDMLTESGLKVEFLPFDGPHTISQAAISATVAALEAAGGENGS
jgi:phospholipase/carboxylesterase